MGRLAVHLAAPGRSHWTRAVTLQTRRAHLDLSRGVRNPVAGSIDVIFGRRPHCNHFWCVLEGSEADVEDRHHEPCRASDGGRPSGFAVQAEIPNHRSVMPVKSRGGKRLRKRARQERVR